MGVGIVGPHLDCSLKQLAALGDGSAGLGRGRLHEIRKTCEYLCGEEAEECHYEALVALEGPLQSIGTPLAAVPGTWGQFRLSQVGSAAADAEAAVPAALIGGDFTPLAWPTHPGEREEPRVASWHPETRKLTLEMRLVNMRSYTIEAPNCRLRTIDELTEITCDGLALITDDRTPLLLSYPDYNSPAADVVAVLEESGARHYLVRLGLKAQTVFGFLIRDEAGWRGLFRPRDYALLC